MGEKVPGLGFVPEVDPDTESEGRRTEYQHLSILRAVDFGQRPLSTPVETPLRFDSALHPSGEVTLPHATGRSRDACAVGEMG